MLARSRVCLANTEFEAFPHGAVLVSPVTEAPYMCTEKDAARTLLSAPVEEQLLSGDIFLLGVRRFAHTIVWGKRSVIVSFQTLISKVPTPMHVLVPGAFQDALFRVGGFYRNPPVPISLTEKAAVFEQAPYGAWDYPPDNASGLKTLPVFFAPPVGQPPTDGFLWSRLVDDTQVQDWFHSPFLGSPAQVITYIVNAQRGKPLPAFRPDWSVIPKPLQECLKGFPRNP